MRDQNNGNDTTQQTTDQPQPIIINNVVSSQPDDSGKPKAPGFLKVVVYSLFTGGIYFFYWLVKSLSHGYRSK